MKYATIGTSWITQSYINAAAYTNKWELYAVYSRNEATAKQFAQQNNVKKYYTSLSALAEDKEIEAIYIASPNALHYEQSKMMLNAGKHVICEKSATITKAEYDELLTLAASKGLIFMEAIMSMYVPGMQIIKEYLPAIGRISSAHIDFCQLSSKYPALQAGQLPNIFNPALCTGALMDLGVYNLYIIAEWFGMPNRILSSASFLDTKVDHTTCGIFAYDDFRVNFSCSKIGQGFSQSEIIGDKGTIGIDSVSQLTGITLRKAKEANVNTLIPLEVNRTEIMSHEALAFYEFITDSESKERYQHIHHTASMVRELCDTIRQQNNFIF